VTLRARGAAVALLAGLSAGLPSARAATFRYALVVGNNQGVDERGEGRPQALRHAEREARRLRDSLVALASFDPAPDRTVLLLGATRAQVMEAARTLGERRVRDLRGAPHAKSLFLYYFTGHGLKEQLLLDDGPLTAEQLGQVFETVHADLSIGVFDACFSGRLVEKRIVPGPPVELPEEVLRAEGRIWFSSSAASQASFEDEEMGGVFTHFFIEALSRGRRDGPGIPLEAVWEYTWKHTVRYVEAQGRRQTPWWLGDFESRGPLYFSFPEKRDATLVLAESVEGDFELSYAEGRFSEHIAKERGRRRRVAVFPGRVRLARTKGGEVRAWQEMDLQAGGTVLVHSEGTVAPSPRVGRRARIVSKGTGERAVGGADAPGLHATLVGPATTWLAGAGVEAGSVPEGVLGLRQAAFIDLRLDHSGLLAGLRLGAGRDDGEPGAWSYDVDALLAGVRAGYGWDLGPVRLGAAASVDVARLWQQYGDGEHRTGWLVRPGGAASLLWPTRGRVSAELLVRSGVSLGPGAGVRAGDLWRGWGAAGLSALVRPD